MKNTFPHYLPVLDSLQKLVKSGVEIVYFEGNHDFHLGKFFSETLRATIYTNPAILDLDGKHVYVCHGDQINIQDYGYRLLRFLLHSRTTKTTFPYFSRLLWYSELPITSHVEAKNTTRKETVKEIISHYLRTLPSISSKMVAMQSSRHIFTFRICR